jgi:hypothetical protein
LPAADERPAIEATRVHQLPELFPAVADDIVDAEIVEASREEMR